VLPEVTTLRELRRAQIVDAARDLVADRGLEALTIGALEQTLDFSRGVITYHFKNKHDIVHAVLDRTVADIDEVAGRAIGASADSEGRVRAVLESMVRGFVDRRDGGQVLLAFWGRLQADERGATVNAELFDRYRCQAEGLVREGQNAGDFCVEVDARALSTVIVGLVIGICLQAYFQAGAVDVNATVEEAVKAVQSRLRVPAS
jgi:AcrR family transcriptional regulator